MRIKRILCTAALAAGAAMSCSPRADLPARFQAYRDARNSHNLEATLAFFAPDAKSFFEGADEPRTIDDIRRSTGWDFVMNAQSTHEIVDVRGDTLQAEIHEMSDFYRHLGLSERNMRIMYVYRDGLIAEQHLVPLPHDGPSTSEALEPFVAWASEHHPEEFAGLYDNGIREFSAEAAAKWLTLLILWREGQPLIPDE